jgi:hypothetical protein
LSLGFQDLQLVYLRLEPAYLGFLFPLGGRAAASLARALFAEPLAGGSGFDYFPWRSAILAAKSGLGGQRGSLGQLLLLSLGNALRILFAVLPLVLLPSIELGVTMDHADIDYWLIRRLPRLGTPTADSRVKRLL